MLLKQPFVKLPFQFDADQLHHEVEALPSDAWRGHPTGHVGNTAVIMVSRFGDHTDDTIGGRHEPTTWLGSDSYLAQTIAAFGVPVGRTRLMRIAAGGVATPHFDLHNYWFDRVRIHVPVITTADVSFECGDAAVHMAAGESWVFDTFRRHNVLNPGGADRVHLVIDTVGTPALWSMIDKGGAPVAVAYEAGRVPVILTERTNLPAVIDPGQLDSFARRLHQLFPADDAAATAIRQATEAYVIAWRSLWAFYGAEPTATGYIAERDRFGRELESLADATIPYNQASAKQITKALFIDSALNGDIVGLVGTRTAPPPVRDVDAVGDQGADRRGDIRFDRPVIIVSPPRAGSTLLFETLAKAPDVFTIGKESHLLMESVPSLQPRNRNWESNELTADDATPQVIEQLRNEFFNDLRDRRETPPPMNASFLRMLEKTPKNSLRIEFLDEVFPDARYIYLSRSPRDEVSSMMDAWRSGGFVTYPDLPGWEGMPWSLLLIPGWRDLIGAPLEEVCARQWEYTTNKVLDDLGRVAPGRWTVASYERLVSEPDAEVRRLCRFANLRWDTRLEGALPLSRHTLTPPSPDKWKANETELAHVLPSLAATAERAAKVADIRPNDRAVAQASARKERLSSVHTDTVAELLGKADADVLLSTYQSGSVITLRRLDDRLNTHFTPMPKPMGIALSGSGQLAVGTSDEVWQYRNQPAVARKIQPEGLYGSCYVMRIRHHTGNIAIHEMAYASDRELWMVNTRFSCLATLDEQHSFVPRWRPTFVTRFSADDRCHLNGLAMRDGRPRYVTAFSESDSPNGWRDTKTFGGCIIDIDNDEIVGRGLCMPHSPRWYRHQMWVLESGKGSLSRVDLATGKAEVFATLPGFTRGLAFIGRYALVGLSQVRESVFDGLPLTKGSEPKHSGLWIVDLDSATIVGFVRFDGVVHEIFDVQVNRSTGHLHVVDVGSEQHLNSFVVPDAALADANANAR